MKRALFVLIALPLLAPALHAQTADEILARYVKTIGGAEKIAAVTTLRRTGRFYGGGGFEAGTTQENKRPDKVREDFIFQGLDAVTAWDGTTGWKIDPFGGKKDAESLGEDERKEIIEDSDFTGPLIDYRAKGNKVELLGMEPVEGTDAYKLKLTLKDGDTSIYYMDTDYFVPIKIESTKMIRGAERTTEITLGDYKEVNGWYLPFSIETNAKGSPNRQKQVWEKIEANVPIDDARFALPKTAALTPADRQGQPVDASEQQPKKDEAKKPATDAKPVPPAKTPGTTR